MTEALDLGKRVELREQIARVIDLDAFEAEIRHIKNGYVPGSPTKIRVEIALRKADEILALTDDRLLSRLREVESVSQSQPCAETGTHIPSSPDTWQPIETAPTGEDIMVWFSPNRGRLKGAYRVQRESAGGVWQVDDEKHGPYSLRGYLSGDDTHWRPLLDPPARAALSNSPLGEGGLGSSVAGLPSSQAGSDSIDCAILERALRDADSELSMIQACLAGIEQDFAQFNGASKKLGTNATRALTSIQDRLALGITRCTEDARDAIAKAVKP